MIQADRYRKIDEIFQAALELAPDERPSFISQACGGEESLIREIEDLLASDERDWELFKIPALELAAPLLTTDQPELVVGERLGHYTIISLLGAGGMGQVYLAEDTRLIRKVALKLLPTGFTQYEARLRRFQQEARAASALNHPNILTIYDIWEIEGRHLIATEYVEGQSLKQRIKQGSLSIEAALDISIQVANALAAAHQAGIIHRDIKPENIMLRRDSYVKVVDFGLAKLTGEYESTTEAGGTTRLDTSSGLVMGTVQYMSPEQAQGQAVDSRSDIFSFGVVLYEMLAGCLPFAGETTSALIAAVLKEEPAPLAEYLPQAPQELQRIISKALRKDKVERYQTAQELLADLRNLKDALEIESKAPSVRYLLASIKGHKTGAAIAFAALLLAALAAGFGVYKYLKLRSAHFENIASTKLTNFGDAWAPSISPDGRYLVYAQKGPGSPGHDGGSIFSVWLKTVGTTNEVQLVPATEGTLFATGFSPDGKFVSYSAELTNQEIATFVIPISGGASTKLLLKRATHVSFSPDGKRLAYLYWNIPAGTTSVVVANADGTDEQEVVTRQPPNTYLTAIKTSWSPDGKLIACVGRNGGESFPHIFVVDVENRTERPLTAQKWNQIRGVAWLPDMSGLVAVAAEETSSVTQVWHLSYPGGEARRITHDTVNYRSLGLSADGKVLVTTKIEVPTSIWITPIEVNDLLGEKRAALSVATGKARQINVTNFSGTGYEWPARLSWTPDGRKIVYTSVESGNADIWAMNADGSNRRQLTTDPHIDTDAVVSRDGRYIAFKSNRAGDDNIWLMDMDGGNQRSLTRTHGLQPVFSADSRWVYFVSSGTVWKIPVEGGEPAQVIADGSIFPAFSPKGESLLYTSLALGKVFIAPAEGGAPPKSFDVRGGRYSSSEFSWKSDGRALTFLWVRDNVSNLWEQPLDGSEPRQLTNFTAPGISKYAFSPDGKQLAIARMNVISDVVLINDLR